MENRLVRRSARRSTIRFSNLYTQVETSIPVFSISRHTDDWPIIPIESPSIDSSFELESDSLHAINTNSQNYNIEKYGKLAYKTIKKLWESNIIKINSINNSAFDKIIETYFKLIETDFKNLNYFFNHVK